MCQVADRHAAIAAPAFCVSLLLLSACAPGADTQPIAVAVTQSEEGGLSDLERYQATEEIKQLKARYFRHMDGKDWDGWQDVFAPDAVFGEPVKRRWLG